MKGQIFESLGFIILSIAIIGIIILIRTYLMGGYGRTFITLTERHESEGLKSGVNSILQTTEPKTGKNMLELVGIVAYMGKSNIDFGPEVEEVDVEKELEWRFDSIYKPGHWYLNVPFADILPRIQVIIIVDTSASLCDDIEEMKNNLPKIIDDLREKGYNIAATLYMLPGGQECCNGKSFSLTCKSTQFPETSYFHCKDISSANCSTRPRNEEDWGRGLACGIESGPLEKWNEFSAKVGIILSDELPEGSEDKGGSRNQQSLNIGKEAAKRIDMTVFPIKTSTGKKCCPSCRDCPSECNICLYWWDENWRWTKTWIFTEIQCDYDERLAEYMEDIASETGGEMYSLESASEITESIKRILTTLNITIKPYMDIGTKVPSNKNVRAVTIPVPVTFIGEYTNIYFYQWS